MLLNMLNDLAEATKASDGKKKARSSGVARKDWCLQQEEESFFPVQRLISIMILSCGSIILISRGLRGGSYFKSE